MTDHDNMLSESELDGLFGASRARPQVLSDDLMARIMADAEANIAQQTTAAPAPREGLAARVIGALGGWIAVAGLATATVAGFSVGVGMTGTVTGLWQAPTETTVTSSYALDDFATSFYDLAAEF